MSQVAGTPAPEPRPGWVEPELAAEFPFIGLRWIEIPRPDEARPLTGRSPAAVRERLRALSNRVSGGRAVNLRQESIPAAYRIFYRQIGIDPDVDRTPPEAVMLERMRAGGFVSDGILWDALTIATVETSIGLMAFDARTVSGQIGLRLAGEGERLGGTPDGRPLSRGQLLVTDAERSLAVLFGDILPDAEISRGTEVALVVAGRVKGIPEVSVEEALWTAYETVSGGP